MFKLRVCAEHQFDAAVSHHICSTSLANTEQVAESPRQPYGRSSTEDFDATAVCNIRTVSKGEWLDLPRNAQGVAYIYTCMHAVAFATLLELTLARSSVDTSVTCDFYRRTREPYSKTTKQYLPVTPNPPRHPCTQASSSVHNERQATA